MRIFVLWRFLKNLAVLAVFPPALFAYSAVAAVTTPNYVQGNCAAPPAQWKVTVPYSAVQTAGNLNVVIVGWNDSTRQVDSVVDSNGNVYELAVGPTVLTGSPALSQSIYYAKNISAALAGANSVTVTFNGVANYPDIRILEYSGIDPLSPLDVSAGATGESATSSSGTVTTENAMDLLVSANVVWTVTTGPGSEFTQRLLTNDGDIAEDRMVTAATSYSATASLSSAGPWIMQMTAFRAAGSSAQPTSPPPTPTPTPTSIPAALSYVQGNAATPSSQTAVSVPYRAAQHAGDLNVVIVGWNDATTQLTSLGDSTGNVYQLAVGPTVLTGSFGLSQAIFYAKNILAAPAGANTVTVAFNAAAYYPDVRILEYSGIDQVSPLDVSAAATGYSTTSSSGSATTKNATDLLLGTNVVWTVTSGPGNGFTQRLLTNFGDIVEDRGLSAVGSYSVTAPLSSAGPWIMHMVAFRAANSAANSAPTSTPVPSPTPTPAPAASPTPSSSVTLTWDSNLSTTNSATNTAGYRLSWGPASGTYTQSVDVGNTTTGTAPNLTGGSTYYFVVTAYNSAGVESPPSNEVASTAP